MHYFYFSKMDWDLILDANAKFDALHFILKDYFERVKRFIDTETLITDLWTRKSIWKFQK